MHELALIQNLLAKVDAVVRDNGGRRAVAVDVWLGGLSHLSADRFADYFEEFSRGTLAEGAWLDIEVSDDVEDENAHRILLRNVEVEVTEGD